MNKEQLAKINEAISNALNLLYSEEESVCIDELAEEYSSVIHELENAQEIIINNLSKN